MHVLVTTDTVGGVWTYTRELVTGLISGGDTVTLVSFGRTPSHEQCAWMAGLQELSFVPTSYPLEWMEDSQSGVGESIAFLKSLIDRNNFDLLHLSQYCYGSLPTSIPKVLVAHSDVFTWWRSVHGSTPPDSPWSCWYRQLVVDGLRAADVVVAPSNWMMSALVEEYGPIADGRVIHNGRTPGLFNPSAKKKNRVISTGRLWDKGKNLEVLMRRQQALPVCIAGLSTASPCRSSLSPKDKWVTVLGNLCESEVSALMAEASIYVATSIYEPFGLAPLEAAFSGCALVMNDIPVFRELWNDNAVFFHHNDADDLPRAIELLNSNPGLGELYSHRAYQRALRYFTCSRMIEDYHQLFRELAVGAAA